MSLEKWIESPERTAAAAARERADAARSSLYKRTAIVVVIFLVPTIFFGLMRPSTEAMSLTGLKAAIHDRATIDLPEDFRSGFMQWSPQSATTTWGIDPAGSVRPGKLALFEPSMAMSDYQFEYLGQVESRAMTFIVRAKDDQNYWAGRLTLSQVGPTPRATIAHWAVVDGKERDFRELPVPATFRPDSLLRIWVSVAGPKIQVAVNGQLCDYWDDKYFTSGGVGFMGGAKGDSFRVISMRVWDKDDLLGQICSRLSANSADSKSPRKALNP